MEGGVPLDRASLERERDAALERPDAPTLQIVEGRPTIVCKAGEIARMVDQADATVAGLCFRSNGLVRLSRDADLAPRTGVRIAEGDLTAVPVTPEWLMLALARHANFVRHDGRSRRHVPIDPPLPLARALLAQADRSAAPVLVGIGQHPTLRADGSPVMEPGYDSASGLYLDFEPDAFPPLAAEPIRRDAETALALLLDVLREFPFAKPEHRSVALALLLTAVVRATLPTAPIFGISAFAPGSGKTYLAAIVGLLQTGRDPAMLSLPVNDENEARKRFFAALQRKPPAIVLDNIVAPLRSEALCTITTVSVWTERLLGASRDVAVSTNTLVIATGNHLTPVGDLVRRSLLCRLDPGVERPEEREFSRDLRVHVLQHRPQLVIAALTVLRAYLLAGSPRPQGIKPLASFERWDHLVRGALLWLGEPDPVATREELRENDPVRERRANLLAAWHEHFGSRQVTASDVVFAANSGAARLQNALVPFAEERGELSTKRLGYSLRGLLGVVTDGLRLSRASRTTEGQAFSIEVCDDS